MSYKILGPRQFCYSYVYMSNTQYNIQIYIYIYIYLYIVSVVREILGNLQKCMKSKKINETDKRHTRAKTPLTFVVEVGDDVA